jgi:DNA-binding helix-hairpin-helix protein with protein kinase domain
MDRSNPCKVGVPEFTPPELQGKNLSMNFRTFNHDYFGLAVLIFYTLMMGRHPFVGCYLGPGDMPPIDRLIADYRFAYSGRHSSTLMDPPPNVPTLADLPMSVGDAFEQAFGPSGPTARVSASDWAAILDRAEGELVPCTSVSAHHYFRSAKSCPWCRMERATPGFQAFVPVFPIGTGGKPLDLGALIAAVRAVKDPGPAPDIVALMPSPAFVKPPIWAEIRKARIRRWMAAIVGAAIGLFCLIAPPLSQAPIMGLFALSLSIVAGARSPGQMKAERGKLGRAEAAWKDAKTAFEQAAGNGFFAHLRQEAELLISRLNETNAEETRRLADLANRKRELQLRHYLDRHHIDQAKIKGIGSGRKLTLKSFGIETAGDIERSKILAISGFGPAIADLLQNWRRRLEASFHFGPNRAIDPADIAAIKAEIASRRVDLEGRVWHAIARLEKTSSDASALRSNPGNEAIDAWTAWKSADQFERELRLSGREAVQLLGVAAICVAAVWILAGVQHSLIVPTGQRVQGKATDFVPRQIEGDHETGLPLRTPHESITGSGGAEASRPSTPGSEAAPNVPAVNSSEPLGPQASISRDAAGGTLPTESPFSSQGNVQKGTDAMPTPTLLPSYAHQEIPLDLRTVAGVESGAKGGFLDLLDHLSAL